MSPLKLTSNIKRTADPFPGDVFSQPPPPPRPLPPLHRSASPPGPGTVGLPIRQPLHTLGQQPLPDPAHRQLRGRLPSAIHPPQAQPPLLRPHLRLRLLLQRRMQRLPLRHLRRLRQQRRLNHQSHDRPSSGRLVSQSSRPRGGQCHTPPHRSR